MKASTNFAFFLVLITTSTMAMAAPPARGGGKGTPNTVEEWFRNLPNVRQKLTKLRFYSHEKIYSASPTAVRISKPDIANKASNVTSLFGLVMVVDHRLTVGPDPDSEAVGWAQGIQASASKREEALFTTVNFVFTSGKFEGSSLSVFGRNPIFKQHRELPVVGGTGVFRLARGAATAETYTFDAKTGDPVMEYNLILLHY